MEETVKFRAWDKQYKEIHKVTMILFDTNELDYEGNYNEPKSIEHFELMQFIGVTDINKTPIYRGDIIKAGENLIAEVVYMNKNVEEYGDEIHAAFHAKIFRHNKIIPIDSYFLNNCTVIGNIYQNPELLPDWKP